MARADLGDFTVAPVAVIDTLGVDPTTRTAASGMR